MKLVLFNFIFLTLIDVVNAEETASLNWIFNHTQDSYGIYGSNNPAVYRTTGVTTLGLTFNPISKPYSFLVDGLWLNRDDPFSPVIGDFNGVSNIAGEKALRLYHAVLSYTPENSNWSGTFGLQAIDDHFFYLNEAVYLINSAFGLSGVITGNTLLPTFPLSSFGGQLRYDNENYIAGIGIYDGNTGSQSANPNGTRLSINNDEGIALVGEFGRKFNTDFQEGSLIFGALHHTGDFTNKINSQLEKNNTVLYLMYESRFKYEENDYGLFAKATTVLEPEHNLIADEFVAGLNWYSPFDSRPDDLITMGLIWTHFSQDAVISLEKNNNSIAHHDEWILEFSYLLKMNDWLTLQPDIQWINNPQSNDRDVIISGLRMVIDF